MEKKKNAMDLNIQADADQDDAIKSPSNVSSFAASRLLKQAEDSVDTVKRRIQMLKVIEDKNSRKMEE